MNDFTKEELELTLGLYQEFMKKYEFSEDVEAITSKIQSLIDSYDELECDICKGFICNTCYDRLRTKREIE